LVNQFDLKTLLVSGLLAKAVQRVPSPSSVPPVSLLFLNIAPPMAEYSPKDSGPGIVPVSVLMGFGSEPFLPGTPLHKVQSHARSRLLREARGGRGMEAGRPVFSRCLSLFPFPAFFGLCGVMMMEGFFPRSNGTVLTPFKPLSTPLIGF